MMLLSLLTCVLLGALSAQAEVGENFENCNTFFYEKVEPSGMDQNAKKICQKLGDDYFFATLYSTFHRIPVYSAYTINKEKKSIAKNKETKNEENCMRRRPLKFFIEPQISGINIAGMAGETKKTLEQIKRNQAINDDYKYTGFDRGHLNPSCFQNGDGRMATFTLTNVAPFDPCFNRVQWQKWEGEVKEILKSHDYIHDGTAYLVTGTVSNNEKRIPQRGETDDCTVPSIEKRKLQRLTIDDDDDDDEEEEKKEEKKEFERVTVPTFVWAALCYAHKKDESQSFSFGCIGENKPNGDIDVMSVSDLNSHLSEKYNAKVEIFAGGCFSDKEKSNKIVNELSLEFKNPTKEQDQKLLATKEPMGKHKGKRKYNRHSEFFKENEESKKKKSEACIVTKLIQSDPNLKRRKRDLGSTGLECQVILEKSNAEVLTTADGTRCQSDLRYCKTESGFKPCCTSPCLYQETHRDFWCYSGETSIPCSPQYSLITAGGEQCKDDHPCAKYGLDYYWCKKDSGSWDYCSPPLPDSITVTGKRCRTNHACGKYGYSYYWCYTDYNNNSEGCCTHNDRFSAVKGKTCKPDHPCGHHGKDYLWCNTTDGKWDYCCVGE